MSSVQVSDIVIFASCAMMVVACSQHVGLSAIPPQTLVQQPERDSRINYQALLEVETNFRSGETDNLRNVFAMWHRSIPPQQVSYIQQNDTIRSVYQVFRTVFKPYDLERLWGWSDRLNGSTGYVVVQDAIYFTVLDTNEGVGEGGTWGPEIRDSISDFRPPVDVDADSVLYLTDGIRESILTFLGKGLRGGGNIRELLRRKGFRNPRRRFLREYIPIFNSGLRGNWYIATQPYIRKIVLNSTLTEARVFVSVGSGGGEANLQRSGEGWLIVSSRATWEE